MIYCTLAEAKREHKATSTADDNILLANVRQATARVNQFMLARTQYPYFGPMVEARQILMEATRINSYLNTLRLDRPLLSLTAAVAHETTVTDVTEGFPQGETPYHLVRITSSGLRWWSYASGCDPVYATITGIWGHHSDYASAWMDVDALAAGINASVTTITVADVDGADQYGLTPRISVGSLLKIGDEFLEVSATDTTANTATVRRGANGSTAAVHSLGDTVYTFQVEEPIRRVVARQAGMMYARRGAYEASVLDGIGQTNYPQDLLNELARVVQGYQYG